jgi:hypothetical protein
MGITVVTSLALVRAATQASDAAVYLDQDISAGLSIGISGIFGKD